MEGIMIVFISLRPKKPGVVSKIDVEVGKITAIEELTERAEVTGSRVHATGGQIFEVKEKPEEIKEEAARQINRVLMRGVLQ